MKKWESPSGVTYRRLTKGIVFKATDSCPRFYRVEQNGLLGFSYDLVYWYPGVSMPEAGQAIAALWPAPTKAQLWRRVARLAGEVALIDGPDIGAFRLGSDYESGADSVRELIKKVSRVRSNTPPAKLEELKKALAAWEEMAK